jgi:hypothetical protein
MSSGLFSRCRDSIQLRIMDDGEGIALFRPGPTSLAIHNQRSPQIDFFRKTDQLPVFKQIIVRAVMGMSYAIGYAPLRIPNHQVCICPRYQGSFTRIKTKYLGWIGAVDGYKLVWGKLA